MNNPISLEEQDYVLNLPYHLAEAGLSDNLYQILIEFDFLDFKLIRKEPQILIDDYSLLSNPHLSLSKRQKAVLLIIQKSIQLSQEILTRYKTQFASQLFGRLQGFNVLEIKTLLKQAKQSRKCWLRPLKSTLNAPDNQLMRTLATNYDEVTVIVISPDGKKVVSDVVSSSNSNKSDLKVWDLETGTELISLANKFSAITSDGQKIISQLYYPNYNYLKIRKLETGEELLTLAGHKSEFKTVVVTPDNKQLISASKDGTIKVWNLATGQELLNFITTKADNFIISPDGQKIITSNKNLIAVWNLSTKKELFTINPNN